MSSRGNVLQDTSGHEVCFSVLGVGCVADDWILLFLTVLTGFRDRTECAISEIG